VIGLLCQSSLYCHNEENMIEAAWPESLTISLHFTQTKPEMSLIILIAKRVIFDSAALILVMGTFWYEYGSSASRAKDEIREEVFFLKCSLVVLTSIVVYLIFRVH